MNEMKSSGNQRYKITVNLGAQIDKETGKKINKLIKETKLKVTSSYLDEKIELLARRLMIFNLYFRCFDHMTQSN